MKNGILRIFPLLLAAVLLITAVAGCGGADKSAAPGASPAAVQPGAETPATAPVPSPAPTPSPDSEPMARTITDMYGRQVAVPSQINKVLCTSPIETILVYQVAPEKLAGLSFTYNGDIVPDEYRELPVVGGWFGTQTGNYETFISMHPDVIIEAREATLEERQTKFGEIPVVGIVSRDGFTSDYEEPIAFLGELLGEQESAANLISYYREAVDYVGSIMEQVPQSERKTVYYAEGKEGLNTDPVGSMHTAVIEFCGGSNVAEVALKEGYGMADVSFEQILLWNPDIIIIGRGSQASLYEKVMSDAKWQQLKAVQNGRVYMRPDNPFSWFDGPPGPNQIIGIYWMAQKFYPDMFTELDLRAKAKEFYGRFYHYELSDAELDELLGTK